MDMSSSNMDFQVGNLLLDLLVSGRLWLQTASANFQYDIKTPHEHQARPSGKPTRATPRRSAAFVAAGGVTRYSKREGMKKSGVHHLGCIEP